MAEKKKHNKNKKIESLYVSSEMAEDETMDQELREGIIRGADEIEKELQSDPSIPSLDEDPEKKQELFNDIVWRLKKEGLWEEEEKPKDKPKEEPKAKPEDKLSAEDRIALLLGREMLHNPKAIRRRKIIGGISGAAIVAVGIFALSMSSEANRERFLSAWNSLAGQELRIDIDNEDGRNQDKFVEQEAYDEIESKLGIKPLHLLYTPEGMNYENYILNEQAGMAVLYYTYKDTLITVYMYNEEDNTSRNQQFEGKIIDSIEIYAGEITVDIWKINSEEDTFSVGFEYDNAYYSIWGSVPEKEFKKVVEKLYF